MFSTYTTGIHYTDKSVEWAVLRKNRVGLEIIRKETQEIHAIEPSGTDPLLFPADALKNHRKNLKGIITLSLPTQHLIMRVLELPATNPDEVKSMVELQIDQISPFPVDQMTISYELLHQTEDHSRVLAVAAQRKTIDQLGDLFKDQGIHIRSLDVEVLAWWSLLVAQAKVPREGRFIFILEEHTEFSFIVVDDGVPICFRSLALFRNFSDPIVQQEIAEELRYTLLSLEAEYKHQTDFQIEIWSESDIPDSLTLRLRELSPKEINLHNLSTLPNLSEGLALRAAEGGLHHIELIPQEWTDLQRRRQALKITTISAITTLALWLIVVTVTLTVFAIRKASFNRVQEEYTRYEAPALAAKNAREEKISLEKYADRSHSALECLREVTEAIPDTLEINSFDYTKNKTVRLRGSSPTKDPIYDFFSKLGSSERFSSIKDDKVDILIRQGERLEGFSVTALLPSSDPEEKP